MLESSNFQRIDFLSLDLEGYECEALRGLDLAKWQPKYILVEVRDFDEISLVLGSEYKLLEVLTDSANYKDMLFVRNYWEKYMPMQTFSDIQQVAIGLAQGYSGSEAPKIDIWCLASEGHLLLFYIRVLFLQIQS